MIRKWQFILAFSALLLFGCSQQPAPETNQNEEQADISVQEITVINF